MTGSVIYDVNAEYARRGHSWYAILSLFYHPLPSPLTPILSSVPSFLTSPSSCSWLILTLCRAAHLLQVDFVEMHGATHTFWYATLICPSSPPRLPLLISLNPFFLSLSDPSNIH